ncbi:MAG: DMT family transporter [Pseudomonadota bacterium]
MPTGDAIPILLALFSALTLAVANVAVKRGVDILLGRAVMGITGAVILIPFAFFVPFPSVEVWWAMALALPAHFFYQVCVVRALHRGDLSQVFPIMRGAAPLLAGLAAWILLGEALPPLAVFGLVIATGAVIFFGMPSGTGAARIQPNPEALLWAGGTALGIALYSVADANGVRAADNPFTYIVWLFILDPIAITTVAAVDRGTALITAMREQWRYGAIAGTMSVLSFGAALLAMDQMEVARVSALRESGIVFAAILAWLFLKEGFGLRRTIAACVLAFGLVLLQLAG